MARNLAVIELTHEECRVVMRALSEVCQRISIRGFHPRTGVEREYAEELLRQFDDLWERLTATN